MSPKEKAKELVKRYRGFGSPNEHISSKQCALICVNEILKTVPQKENEIFGISKGLKYWQEVKQEIEKLL